MNSQTEWKSIKSRSSTDRQRQTEADRMRKKLGVDYVAPFESMHQHHHRETPVKAKREEKRQG